MILRKQMTSSVIISFLKVLKDPGLALCWRACKRALPVIFRLIYLPENCLSFLSKIYTVLRMNLIVPKNLRKWVFVKCFFKKLKNTYLNNLRDLRIPDRPYVFFFALKTLNIPVSLDLLVNWIYENL